MKITKKDPTKQKTHVTSVKKLPRKKQIQSSVKIFQKKSSSATNAFKRDNHFKKDKEKNLQQRKQVQINTSIIKKHIFNQQCERMQESQQVNWPSSLNNEGWKQAAMNAANSWGKTINEYLKDAYIFLQNYKKNYRRSRNLEDLIPLEKALNDQSQTPKFAFKERQR